MKLLMKYFRRAVSAFPKQFAVSMGLAAVLTLMDAWMPWGLRKFLEQITLTDSVSLLLGGIGLFAVYLLIRVLVHTSWYVSLDWFGGRYMESLTLSLEQAMAETTYEEIEKKKPGVVRNILYTDVLNIFRTIGFTVPSMVGALAVMVVALCVALAYGLGVTLFILAAVLLGLLLSWCSRKILAKYAGRTNAKMKVHDAFCTQFVEQLPLIQSHDVLPYFQEKTAGNLRDFISTAVQEDRRVNFWASLAVSYHSLFSIALSAILALPMAGNSMANLVFFTMIANLVMGQAQTVEQQFQLSMRYLVSFRHAEDLLALPKRGGDREAAPIHTMDFQNVAFTYPNGVNALRDVSCHLERGDVLQLKGGNGSGKSTFIKLLMGLYPPAEGQILLDGRPMEQFTRESLNRQILYVSQDEKCLNETFKRYLEVITGQSLSREAYEKLIDLVQLPGDDRVMSENGNSISVGQRKKLFILKLLLRQKEASIIILDELTAGLDAETTKLVYSLLHETAQRKDKIVLLVDHTLPEEAEINGCLTFQDMQVTRT